MSMERTHVWELVAHYKDDKPAATLWWDGRYVQCDDPKLFALIKNGEMFSNHFEHSTDFLDKELPNIFKNGYMMARKKKD